MYPDIILENKHFRLTIGSDCCPKSLLHKATCQECLDTYDGTALFSLTQPRPYNNEIKLAYPNKRTTFQANRVRREGDFLIVGFEISPYEAKIALTVTDAYISFRLDGFIFPSHSFPGYMDTSGAPVESFRILQLPVKNRANFGQWLNVSWDEAVAVNVLATSPYAIIDAEKRKNYKIFTADALREVKLIGTEAALIVTDTPHFLDAVDQLEQDYDLPRGVQSRSSQEIRQSQYLASWLNPDTVDQHIQYCKQCGYKMMTLYYASAFEGADYHGCGDYDDSDYRETYPNGFESLKEMVGKIKAAGITPGLHILHPHIGMRSRYVTPVADHRLHKLHYFTLSKALNAEDTTVYVEENPECCIVADKCRVLQFGGELISYEGFTTKRPYCFTGCKRGYNDTYITEHPLGQIGGILDVSEYGATSCYLDQSSSLQEEVSAKLAKVYSAGFAYIYFDGSEGVNEPCAFHVANGQYRTYKLMQPAPLLCEGAAKTHFSWHMLTGGNAFDVFPPSIFKEMIRVHPADEAVRMRQDFTRLNFGWWGFYVEEDGGIQPDHWEYGTSLAAAFDCPGTFSARLPNMAAHPRTDDLLEVLRRWEDVRLSGWLTEEQKREIIENQLQEHILLINEQKEYELVPYAQIPTADEHLRAFGFERNGKSYVVYWHTAGEGKLTLPFPVALQEELYAPMEETATLPISHRRYVSSDLPLAQLEKAFAQAKIIGITRRNHQ